MVSTHWPKNLMDIHKYTNTNESKHSCLSYKKMSKVCDPIYLTTGLSGISQQSEKKQQRQTADEMSQDRRKRGSYSVKISPLGVFGVTCQKGGPRFPSVLQAETGRVMSHKKNKLYLVGTQCCLTFDYLCVMIYAHTLSI